MNYRYQMISQKKTNKLSHYLYILCVAVCAGTPFFSFAETMVTTRETDLKEDHFLDATTLAKIPFSASVEALKFESGWVQVKHNNKLGWVRAMSVKGSSTVEVSALSKVESGRSGQKNSMSTTGVRSLSKGSRHALIIGVGQYSAPNIQGLAGVGNDVESAHKMASTMLIPEANIHYLRDNEASASNIEEEIKNLEARVNPGDRVFIYYSGHGTRWPDPESNGSCTEGLLASDGQALSNKQMSSLIGPIAKKTDKLLVFYDACHSGGIVNQPFKTRSLLSSNSVLAPKFSSAGTNETCSRPSNMRTRSLTGELNKEGVMPENVVFIAASRPDEVSFDDSKKGGLATTAWRDCFLGEAKDLDQSGAISVEEITSCAQDKVDSSLSKYPDILGQKMTIGGNKGFVPAFFNQSFEALTSPALTVAQSQTQSNPMVSLSPNTAAEPSPMAPMNIGGNKESEKTSVPPVNLASNTQNQQVTASTGTTKPAEQNKTAIKPLNEDKNIAKPVDSAPLNALVSVEPTLAKPSTKPVSPAQILKQVFDQRDSSRELKVTLNQTTLRINRDPLQFTVTSPNDGYVYVALAGSDQKSLYLIYPNEIDTNNQILANQTISLPRPKWRITAGGPKGTDTLLVLVTDSPRDISQLKSEKEGPFLKSLLSTEGKSQLQSLLNNSENSDQEVCQQGGKTRYLKVSLNCSDAFAAQLLRIEEN